jgi:hypothetical protein
MLFIGMLLFSILAIGISFVIFKKYETLERAEVSTYIALVAWGSLLFGFFISKV